MVGLQFEQTAHRSRVDLDPALPGAVHVRQVDPGDHVVAVQLALGGYLREFARDVLERQVGAALGAQRERQGRPAGQSKGLGIVSVLTVTDGSALGLFDGIESLTGSMAGWVWRWAPSARWGGSRDWFLGIARV